MGGALSLSDDNDELIDNLVASGYLKTAKIEQAMRCVDRGDYFPKNVRHKAYRDIAWKDGFLHLSAPCIYAKVLECLDVQPGMMFLNLGSGTGYLSTVIGFLLGSSGYNYGLEVNDQALEYSIERFKHFLANSIYLDSREFCAPSFFAGNCFQLDAAAGAQSFDRVYCGATVPQDRVDHLKHFLKIDGLLVYPQDDQLFVLKRNALESFDKTAVLPVSFASMVPPDNSEIVNIRAALPKSSNERHPQNQPYNCLEYRIRGGIGLCIFSARRRERQHFNNFINRIINPAVLASAAENENLFTNNRNVEGVDHNGSSPSDVKNANSRLLPSTSTTNEPLVESNTGNEDSDFDSELLSQDDLLKGSYLPNNASDNVGDDLHGLNGESLQSDESQTQDDSGFLSASNVNKRFRTKSSCSEDSDRKERRKIVCIDHPATLEKSVFASNKKRVDVETMTNEEAYEPLYNPPQIFTPPNDNSGETDEVDADEVDSTTSSGVDSDWEQIHREHTKKDRERSRARLRSFADDFECRLAVLPLPRCLIDYVAYGKRLEIRGCGGHCVEN